jgi:epoxyqueuosine reductase
VNPARNAEAAKELARAVGFDLVGIAKAEPTEQTRFIREWAGRGLGGPADGPLDYVLRRLDEREDPRRVLPGVRSVVAVGLVYDTGGSPETAGATETAGADKRDDSSPRIARYARGDDYHDVMQDRLRALASALEAWCRHGLEVRTYVDTGPVQERVFAAEAGLGWIGKNTMLIHPSLGSYVFLGVLLTQLPMTPDAGEPDHCGTCRACLDACPTDAFVEPHVLDATRCLSYTTIEDPGPIPHALRDRHGPWLFGCDVCQEVCPFNQRRAASLPPDPLGLRARLEERDEWALPSLAWVLDLDEEAWRDATRRSPLRRAKRRGLLRNALVAAGNAGDASLRSRVERHANGDDPILAEHARWALERLGT